MEKSKVYTSKVSPFVKWAGGKHQLLPIIREKIPKKFNNYIEPFVGGGALVFDLLPVHATINDINKALINTYRQIKNVPEDFLRAISLYDDKIIDGGKEYYYKMRELYNDKMMKSEYDVELAALFVFLNKHCFNGLYRVNSKGLFNVPYNNSIKKSCDPKNISEVSTQLKKINILEGDFQVVCETATKGDFVFIDSPYVPLKPSSFESYTKEGFDIESHKRLSKVFTDLTVKGCYCMLTNHNTEFLKDLYCDYNMEVFDVKRMINSDANNRVGQEIIITNY